MNITSLFNPWTYVAGAVIVAALGGTFAYQSHVIHAWHVKYDTDEKTIGILQDRLTQATIVAKAHQDTTTTTVTKVISVPAPPVVKIIHDAPLPKDCSTPAIDVLRNNT